MPGPTRCADALVLFGSNESVKVPAIAVREYGCVCEYSPGNSSVPEHVAVPLDHCEVGPGGHCGDSLFVHAVPVSRGRADIGAATVYQRQLVVDGFGNVERDDEMALRGRDDAVPVLVIARKEERTDCGAEWQRSRILPPVVRLEVITGERRGQRQRVAVDVIGPIPVDENVVHPRGKRALEHQVDAGAQATHSVKPQIRCRPPWYNHRSSALRQGLPDQSGHAAGSRR